MTVAHRMWAAGNGSRKLLIAYVLFVVSAVVLLASVLTVTLGRPEPWDPLGDYPTQRIRNAGRIVKIADSVVVDAVKCADEQVTVTSSTRWQSIDPHGTQILTGAGTAVRREGCEKFHYANPIPRSVREVIQAGGPRKWVLSGTETPLRDGKQGVPRAWQTEPFEVVP